MLILLLSCSKANYPPVLDGELQPNFWQHFEQSLGCWPDHLYAWNIEGTVGLDVFIAHPFSQIDEPEMFTIDLSKPGNIVMVETGRQIPDNFCVTDIQTIPVSRVYESKSGMIEVQVDLEEQKLGARLKQVELYHPETKHKITIPNLRFPLQSLYHRKK